MLVDLSEERVPCLYGHEAAQWSVPVGFAGHSSSGSFEAIVVCYGNMRRSQVRMKY